MIINCHKINLDIYKKHILGTHITYFEMTLHVDIAFRVDFSPKVV
jgi:hypothetical protein